MFEGLIKLGTFLKTKLLFFWKRTDSHNINTSGNGNIIQINETSAIPSGKGGNATVNGDGIAKGGHGGKSGPWGHGGNGGDAYVVGNGTAIGGEGGEAAQLDRGGKGGRSAMEVHGIPNMQLPDGSWLWDYGRGGDGAPPSTPNNAPSSQ
jgi:hypothetical protein